MALWSRVLGKGSWRTEKTRKGRQRVIGRSSRDGRIVHLGREIPVELSVVVVHLAAVMAERTVVLLNRAMPIGSSTIVSVI